MNYKKILTKQDVARCEIDTAIYLYFGNKDAITTTLAVKAASVILTGIAKHTGRMAVIENKIDKYIKPGKKKDVYSIFNKAYNFFKHADSDADKTLDFDPEVNRYFLFLAIQIYKDLFNEITIEMNAFLIYFFKNDDFDCYVLEKSKELDDFFEKLTDSMKDYNKETFFKILNEFRETLK